MSDFTRVCASCQVQGSLPACSRCKITYYCSKECQVSDWKTHKQSCTRKSVTDLLSFRPGSSPTIQDIIGVKIFPTQGDSGFKGVAHSFALSDAIFTRGELCPFTGIYGIPILIFSPSIHLGKQGDGEDNQVAVYLRIEPDSGFAPPKWQVLEPGTCFAVRKDKRPLTPELLETMYSFHGSILGSDYFEKEPQDRDYRITPQRFKEFSDKYWNEQTDNGRSIPDLML